MQLVLLYYTWPFKIQRDIPYSLLDNSSKFLPFWAMSHDSMIGLWILWSHQSQNWFVDPTPKEMTILPFCSKTEFHAKNIPMMHKKIQNSTHLDSNKFLKRCIVVFTEKIFILVKWPKCPFWSQNPDFALKLHFHSNNDPETLWMTLKL